MDDPEIFELALRMPTHDRAAVILDACGGHEARARSMIELVALAARNEPVTTRAEDDDAGASELRCEGDRIGRYVIARFLGQGAFGQVYEAFDLELRRSVAIKILREDRASEGDRRRFRREAQSLAQIDHPNVVRVYDAGEHEGCRYLTMELIEGISLRAWLAGPGQAVGWWRVLDVLLPAARGLQAAHAAGIVHRDFKPENVMIDAGGRVVVTDFGIARSAVSDEGASGEARRGSGGGSSQGSTASAIGTPHYMAPEQFHGRATPRSDQFAFCRVVAEALGVGARSEPARVRTVSLAKDSSGELSELRGPRWLRKLLLRGLQAEECERFEDLATLVRAIESRRWRRRWLPRFAALALVAAPVLFAFARRETVTCEAWDAIALRDAFAPTWTRLDERARAATHAAPAIDQLGAMRTRVEGELDELAAARTETCRSRIAGALDDATARARDECFVRWHDALQRRLSWTVDHPDALVHASFLDALPSHPGRCATVSLPSADEPELAAEERGAIELRIAEAEDLRLEGDFPGSERVAVEALALAERSGHAGYRAELEHRLGVLAARRGDPTRALALLEHATTEAERLGLDALAAEIDFRIAETIALASSLRPTDAAPFLALARAKLDRSASEDAELRAELDAVAGHVALRLGDFVEAEDDYRRAAEGFETLAHPAEHLASAARSNLARAISHQGRHSEAVDLAEATLAQRSNMLGSSHPMLAKERFEVGLIRARAASAIIDPDSARAELLAAENHFQTAAALARVVFGPRSIEFGDALVELTRVRLSMGMHDDRVAHDVAEFVGLFEDPVVAATPKAVLRALRVARNAHTARQAWPDALTLARKVVERIAPGARRGDVDAREDVIVLASYELAAGEAVAAERRIRELEIVDPPMAVGDETYREQLHLLWHALQQSSQAKEPRP